MYVTIPLAGQRGQKYRILVSQMGDDVGGGIRWTVQQWKETTREHAWRNLAHGREDSGDVGSKLLAGWLANPMPPKGE